MPGEAVAQTTNAATTAATTTPQQQTPAAGSTAAGVARHPVGTIGHRLLTTPRAQMPNTIPTAAKPAVVAPPTSVTTAAAVIAPADAAKAVAPSVATTSQESTPPAKVDPPVAVGSVLGKGGAPVPPEAISDVRTRERNRVLRAEYGTTDPVEIEKIKTLRKAQQEEYVALKAQQEESTRAAMSEQERLKADNEALVAKNTELANRIHEMETGQVVSNQTQELSKLAGQYIDPTMLDYALGDFQRYVNKLPEKEVKRLTPRAIDRWFAKLATDKPRFRIVLDAPAGQESTNGQANGATTGQLPAKIENAKPVRRVNLSTSALPKGGAAKGGAAKPEPGSVAGKVIRPGQANSMSKAELNSLLKSRGIRPW